jgi:prenyltransferase beta subunit
MKSLSVKIIIALAICLLLNINAFSIGISSAYPSLQTQTDITDAISTGFDYLSSQINEDGGIRWMDEKSSVSATIRVVLALSAHQQTQDRLISASGNRPIDYLAATAEDWVYQRESGTPAFSAARAGQLLTAIAAANENPHAFGINSSDLVYEIHSIYNPNTGIYGTSSENKVLDQVWSMLGLAANHAGIPEEASLWLAKSQLEDGSWDDGFGSYLDTTPLAIMALTSAGWPVESQEIQSALSYLKANQEENGGWQTQWDSTTNANTTGMILQSLSAVGQNPEEDQWQIMDKNPNSALLDIQQENGAFGVDFANAYSTADALLGLSGKPMFQLGILKSISIGFDYLVSLQDQNGGWGSLGQTIDVMMAFQAAGWDPSTISLEGRTPDEFLIQDIEDYIQSGPDAVSKTILAAVISGNNPSQFGGNDLVQILLEYYDPQQGSFGDPQNTWHQSFSLLALSAANAEIPDGIIETLIQLQQPDGGWEYSPGMGTSPDTTGLVIQGLLAGGLQANSEAINRGIDYLRVNQSNDGGWGDSSTTGFVMMTINAIGQSLDEWTTESGQTPLNALLTYQHLNGAFFFSQEYPDDSIMSTATALLALADGSYLVDQPPQNENNFALVVVLPEASESNVACVSFKEANISGLELLERSDFTFEAPDGFMDSILGIGNPEGGTLYWSYWRWNGREWVFNTTGAGESKVFPGSIEAWYLTSWEQFPSQPSRYIPDFESLCSSNESKNFVVQPYLHYSELDILKITSVRQNPIPTELVGGNEQVQSSPTPTPEELFTNENQNPPSRSVVPIIIISVVGLSLLIIVIVLLSKPK